MANEQAQAAATQAQTAESAEITQEAPASMNKEQLLAAMSAPVPSEDEGEVDGKETEVGQESEEASHAAAETEETHDDPEETQGEEQPKKKSKNFRGQWGHLNDQERQVVELTTKRGMSLSEALGSVYGSQTNDQEKQQVDKTADAISALDGQIADGQKALDDLKRQRKETFDPDERERLADEYSEKREELSRLKMRRDFVAERQEEASKSEKQRSQEQFNSRLSEAMSQAREEYPEAFKDGTEFNQELSEEFEYLQGIQSPLLHDPNYPIRLSKRVARRLGYKKPDSAPDPKTLAKPASPAQKRSVRPVATGGTPVEAAATTLEQRIAGAKSADAMLELMRELGTPFEKLTGGR